MVFQIRWTEDYTKGHYALFDVEIWETKGVTNKWYTELRAHSLVEGITRYLMAQNDNVNFNVEEFIKGVPNCMVIDSKEVENLSTEELADKADEMDEIMIKQFKESFDLINSQLNDQFRKLFGGGRASLKLVDPNDILNTGIEIDVQPPGKNIQNLTLLSGGEKAKIKNIIKCFLVLKHFYSLLEQKKIVTILHYLVHLHLRLLNHLNHHQHNLLHHLLN